MECGFWVGYYSGSAGISRVGKAVPLAVREASLASKALVVAKESSEAAEMAIKEARKITKKMLAMQ